MHDLYQMPALLLTLLLVPTFVHLYRRTRDIRNLLWLLAFTFVVLRMLLLYPVDVFGLAREETPWAAGVAQAFALFAAALFLGSLSPLSFRMGRLRILYVVPFTAPLILYALLAHGLYRDGTEAQGVMYWVFPALGFCSILVGVFWGFAKGTLPAWAGVFVSAAFGGTAVWLYFRTGLSWPLTLAESGIHILTALLILSVFRRITPGVGLSVLGFALWALPLLLLDPAFNQTGPRVILLRLIVSAKLVTALGLILLTLENELAANKATSDRERRARQEMEAYSSLIQSRQRIEDFDRQADQVCATVTTHSRFSQAALLLLHPAGMYQVAGSAGLDGATVSALDSLAARISVTDFLQPGSLTSVLHGSETVRLDLAQWMLPGDDLERLHFKSALAVPLRGRVGVEGALLLAGMRDGLGCEALRREDLIPVEILVARLQAVRSQTRMLEKLLSSEKFAGLGQLTGNVSQQLNNPLTVILGYASLLGDSPHIDVQERRGVEAILSSARGMRSTLDSLQRVAHTPGAPLTAVSITDLLGDLEHLHRSEFLRRSINLRIHLEDDLPRVLCQPQQLHQAVLHCLQFAIDAVDHPNNESDRSITIKAATEGPTVQIMIGHSGPAFAEPERAFDPFMPAHARASETAGLGLSLCASLLRENNGTAKACNLENGGAAILLELEAA